MVVIKVHSSLNHKNIVKMIRTFEDYENHYFLLELCEDGELLNFLLKNQK